MFKRTLLMAAALMAAPLALADWTLQPQSTISFASIKNTNNFESHYFRDFDGLVTSAGAATVNIRLTSVDTGVAIRDERMRSMLFDVSAYPTAVLQMSVPKATLEAVSEGKTSDFEASGALALHGQRVPLKVHLIATPGSDGNIIVDTPTPLLINAASFMLTDGIDKLREIAKLDSIAYTVPVSVHLVFKPE
jgi:polyisoprenoid-binding protein YceI